MRHRPIQAAGVFLFTLFMGVVLFVSERSSAQSSSPPQSAPRVAAQTYKNLQVLGEAPADRIVPTMQFMSNSLGVECGYCHVDGAFESDDKLSKVTARKMMRMEIAINRDNFNGRTAVTCNSCHRSSTRPLSVPDISAEVTNDSGGATPTSADAKTVPLPQADELLNRYIKALGGTSAIAGVTSRVEKGRMLRDGSATPFEATTKAPNKRIEVTRRANGDAVSAFDGRSGWTSTPGAEALDMSQAAAEYFSFDADLQFPLRLKQIFSEVVVGTPEPVRSRPANVLVGKRQGQPPVTMFFDRETGLLVRVVRATATPLGANPWQIDFDDYRPDHGVLIPFKRTFFQFHFEYTVQIDSIEQNVSIDDSKFKKPR